MMIFKEFIKLEYLYDKIKTPKPVEYKLWEQKTL